MNHTSSLGYFVPCQIWEARFLAKMVPARVVMSPRAENSVTGDLYAFLDEDRTKTSVTAWGFGA